MKSYILTAIYGAVLGQVDLKVKKGTPVVFPQARGEDVNSAGEMGEVMVTGTDDDGNQIEQVWLYAKWKTGGANWRSDVWV